MRIVKPLSRALFSSGVLLVTAATFIAQGQQVVQRGTFGKPAQVLDETEQWTTPLLLVSDADVQIYIPDVTATEWLKRNYSHYEDRGVYTLSMFTFYKTPAACRANQINWGLGDAEHLSDCNSIGYRVRRALINPHEKSVTLVMAAMVGSNGEIVSKSVITDHSFRFWDQLDANTQTALNKANALVAEQMKIYDRKLRDNP